MTDISHVSQPATAVPNVRSAAEPLTFGSTVGLFTPSATPTSSDIAVLFASPWGLEEMCTRKFWRVMAEQFSARGIASLRFDYPGTGDALDDIDFTAGLSVWADSLIAAGVQLRARSGCRKIVVVSQGLGAAVATRAAAGIEGLEAIAYLAPVVSGRLHLRELAVWSKVVDENLGLSDGQRIRDQVSIASLTMPDEIADEIRRVNLMMIDQPPAPRALVVARADRPSDWEFAVRLQALGVDVSERPFNEYDRLVGNPVLSKLPLAVADEIVDWIASLSVETVAKPVPQPSAVSPLIGEGFAETPVRFGSNCRLSGVLSEPTHGRTGATVLFLTSAYDRHSGWGRTTVAMARMLARSGIASLRFDTANAADSPPIGGRPEQVLYQSGQNADVSEAIDLLEARQLGPVVTAGRCSGAYLGFQAALVDLRISGNISVNPVVFRWKPDRSVEDAIVNGTRSLNYYGQRAMSADTLRRILKGEVNLRLAGWNIIKGMRSRLSVKLLHAFRFVLPEGRAVHAAFASLQARGVPVSLIYSEDDIGLEHYEFYFGRDGAGLAHFPNVSTTMIPNADHNLTPDHARRIYLEALRQMAFRFTPAIERNRSKPRNAIAAE